MKTFRIKSESSTIVFDAEQHTSGPRESMEVLIAIIVVLAGLFFAVLGVVVEILFRRHEVGEVWREVLTIEKEIRQRVKQVVSRVRKDEQEFAQATRRYENAYIRSLLQRRPIRDLRPYVSVSMSWSALERAGISNLNQFLKFRGDFQRLHGIGEARARALRGAHRELQHEMQQTTLPMPTVRQPGTLEFDVVSRIVRIVDLRTKVRPHLEGMEQKMDSLRQMRPNALGARWRFLVGDRDQLHRTLSDLYGEYRTLGEQQLQGLEKSEQSAGIGTTDLEEITDVYGERQELAKKVIDSVTRRTVRGVVRPVGAAAMRAAEGFEDEEDFCDRGLEPLIDKLGYRFEREFTIKRRIGSREKTLYVDFLLVDNQGRKVAILEAKRNIRNERQLDDARQQALSYALFKELTPTMVAAPQGLWLYERRGQDTRLCAQYDMEEAYENIDRLRTQIEALRG